MNSLRNALAVITGLIAGFVVIMMVEMLNFSLFPPPAGFDMTKPGAMEELMKNIPAGALLVVAAAHFFGCLAGGLVAASVSKERRMNSAIITGTIFLALGIMNLVMVPLHPAWFWAADIIVYLPGAWLGGKLSLKLKP